VLGAPAGAADVTIRYSNNVGALGGPAPRTVSLVVDGTSTQVTLPATASWDDWSTVTVPVALKADDNAVSVDCAAGDDCNVNVDDISVTAPSATAAAFTPADPLGGYLRSFDSTNGSYTASPTCASGQSGATCQADIPSTAPGLLDKSGWYLLDDTQSDVWTSDGWIAPRPAGDIQDGYLFGYGQDYSSALEDLAKLTGPAPLLPEYLFGNWLSRYYPYTTADYEDQILPQYQANGIALDTLSVDTDWKSPNTWDGWEWNPSLFPDPQSFLSWAQAQEVHVDVNIHSSVATNDPGYAEAQSIAGGTLAAVDLLRRPHHVRRVRLEQPGAGRGELRPPAAPLQRRRRLHLARLVLRRQRRRHARRDPGQLDQPPLRAADDQHRAARLRALPDRRLAAELGGRLVPDRPVGGPPLGGRVHRRHVEHLEHARDGGAARAGRGLDRRALRQRRHRRLPRRAQRRAERPRRPVPALAAARHLPADHARALHSGQNARLPWEYDSATQAVGDQFLQLREQLVPYLYTLGQQASSTGLPMTQALYLDYPDQAAAYDNPTEYLLGQDMLVAPVTTPGQVAQTSVWFPPGEWTDWFTGATFQGPSTQTLDVPDSRMPVFVKAGGIVPLQSSATSHAQDAGTAPLTLRVIDGANGQYSMYDDAGTGLGYQKGQDTQTPISTVVNGSKTTTVQIGSAHGSYPGAPRSRTYTVDLVDVSAPHTVLVDGRTLPSSKWKYDASTHTLAVSVGAVPTNRTETITQIGGSAVRLSEPAATQLTINPANSLSVAAGSTTTVSSTFTDSGPGSVNGVSLTLSVPSGWQATPTTSTTAGTLSAGGTLTASWSVTAPASASGQQQQATLSANATYTDAVTGQAETDTAQQVPTPAITAVAPATASAGQTVTVTGTNFGTGQDGSYLTFSDDGTNWGAPPDEATFTIDSWSENKITFTVPEPSGTNGVWAVVPGTTATMTVTNPDGVASNTGTVTIGG
jgi:hypothetical protein